MGQGVEGEGATAQRREYRLLLSDLARSLPAPAGLSVQLRPAVASDAQALAELMIEAYRGTIDYDGETLADAEEEILAYLSGERGGPPLLGESRLAFAGALLVGACLSLNWQERQTPLIAYVMTRAGWKGQGLGRLLLESALQALRERGYDDVRAVITRGNLPSERLFDRVGFQLVSRNRFCQ